MVSSLLVYAAVFSYLHIIKATFLTSRASPAPYIHNFKNLIEDEYVIGLHYNYTIEQHCQHVGINLLETGHIIDSIPELNMYTVRIDSHTIHNSIRWDPGVDFVQHHTYVEHPEQEIHGEEEMEIPWQGTGLIRRWKKTEWEFEWGLRAIWTWGKLPTPIYDGGKSVSVQYASLGAIMGRVFIPDSGWL
jgi:hypothetical protein